MRSKEIKQSVAIYNSSLIFFPQTVPEKGTVLSSEQAMRLAISEAYKGATGASPNPLVGSVVLDSQGRFLSSGYHKKYGGPHAEVHAVQDLSTEQLQGAQVFVTLEPCAHEGKTPSCAKMLAKLPIKKVTFGLIDPNPLVAGQGAEILKQAGIDAEVFSSADAKEDQKIKTLLEEACEAFLWNFRQKKVFVALKMASSLDGQVALENGESQWITGPESREEVHYLRACYDAVLVGRGTVLFDNPSLNIRHSKITKTNKVVVIDEKAELLAQYNSLKISQNHARENVFWCVSKEYQSQVPLDVQGLNICYVKSKQGLLDLEDLLQQLWQRGLRSVLVEGGAKTASAFLSCGLVNRLYLFQAAILMGAGGGLSWTSGLKISSMKNKLVLRHPQFALFGQDVMTTGTLEFQPQKESTMTTNLTPQDYRWTRVKDGAIAGVCKGLGRAFGIETWMLRVIWLIAALWFGTGFVVYLILAVCLPREDQLDQALDSKLLGVCARIAKRYNVEVGGVRIAAVLLALTTFGAAILVYGLCYFMIPTVEPRKSP
jgi:diaminohydroxyphosphoribosylaminopyrimidine deaminase/5-amino-6-(5-phosphoribosylamino)uracil reductase